jgi:superoxide dismutase, Cu-Zn family
MFRRATTALALVAALASGCASVPRQPATTRAALPLASVGTAQRAVANLAAASGTLASGRLQLLAEPGAVRVRGTLGGMHAGAAHLLQAHERGDCSAVDARSAGPAVSLAPAAAPVGASLRADRDGRAVVDLLLPGVVLGGGARNDIDGRALVLSRADVAHAGARVACGIISVEG